MAFDGLLAEVELGGDLLVGVTVGDQVRHLHLPGAQGGHAVADRVAPALWPGGAPAEGPQLAGCFIPVARRAHVIELGASTLELTESGVAIGRCERSSGEEPGASF